VSGGAWLAVALLVLVAGAPSALPSRVTALTAAARLAPSGRRRRPAGRYPRPRIAAGAAVAAVAGVGVVAGPALAAALGFALGVVALLWRDAVRGRVETRRQAELLAVVRVLVAELDAGARPGDALDAAAYVAPVHADVLRSAAGAARAGDHPGAVLVATADTRTLGVAWEVIERRARC
jgi:Flp pilus assembly protein TadB